MEHEHLTTLAQCPICGNPGFSPLLQAKDYTASQESFILADCHHCGFRVTNPRPTLRAIGRYYESSAYISHTNSSKGAFDRIYQLARKRALQSKHNTIRKATSQGTLLDIGCGTGEFAAHMQKQGYRVQGVEPSPGARLQAEQNHRLRVFADLDQVPTHEQFKVVTMWHVLEHLHDPSKTMKQIHARMERAGHLFIAVPDRESWDAAHYQDLWAAYDVPRHLSHFRRTDMFRLLNQHGFRIKGARKMWMDAPYVSILSEKNKGTSSAVAFGKGILLGTWSNLVSALTSRPTSSTLYLAQKEEA